MTRQFRPVMEQESMQFLGLAPMDNEHFQNARRDRSTATSLFGTKQADQHDLTSDDLRTGRDAFSDTFPLAVFNPARVWESLTPISLDADFLHGNGLFPFADSSPVGPAFDMLRTRVSQAMAERGWRRIGITSPTHGCGKSFVAINFAFAMARNAGKTVTLLDFDLRRPALHKLLGLNAPGELREFLEGTQPMESLFLRVGKNLALGLNGAPVADASELLQSNDCLQALDALDVQLNSDFVVCDMPPTLVADDVIGLTGKLDAVLLVVDGTRTTAKDIKACEHLFEGRLPLMGVVMNRAQDRGLGKLGYGKE